MSFSKIHRSLPALLKQIQLTVQGCVVSVLCVVYLLVFICSSEGVCITLTNRKGLIYLHFVDKEGVGVCQRV